jgi:pentatricopeptide repeat protein
VCAAETYGYVEPSAVTYNTLISACGKAGKYSEALEVAAAMHARGHMPDSFTVCSLIAAGGNAGQWQSALATFQDFCASGGRPNTAAYNALVRGHLTAVQESALPKGLYHGPCNYSQKSMVLGAQVCCADTCWFAFCAFHNWCVELQAL